MTGAASTSQRFRGVLLGGAVGDALGAAVEFMSRTEILAWFGPEGIRDFVPVDGRLGAITDDTQLSAFCAEALLRAHAAGVERENAATHALERSRSYLRWLLTQGVSHPLLDAPQSWLMDQPDLFHRRGPGQTCLASLSAMRSLGEHAANASKGCGGVMRVAPIGLFHSHWHKASDSFDTQVFAAGAHDAALTHGHPSGHLPAGFLALLIALLVAGVPLGSALERARRQLLARPRHEETAVAVDRALLFARTDPWDPALLARLGHGWVGEEALAMALYCAVGCARTGDDLERAVVLAVNHDGDSDSTGAITGSLLGALRGEQAIPGRWLDAVELRETVTTLADDLAGIPEGEWEPGSAARLRYHGG
ncbi:MAG TPA: ADP-ribosylglycohydrolase family protein [Burkholderiaceae bacterium]|nr:ADP-ribosylglycohydrolase family protein [Burkholderiaceae bacterium]